MTLPAVESDSVLACAAAPVTEAVPASAPVAVTDLGPLEASGLEQMALDGRLLDGIEPTGDGAAGVAVRRYTWTPAAVSLGKFQRFAAGATAALTAAGLDVVRRPSGGRLVLHGAGFEWSFAVALPAGLLPYGTHAAYRLVAGAMAAALDAMGWTPDAAGRTVDDGIAGSRQAAGRREPYTRSALCFATVLRHDLLLDGRKAVAVAQARRGDRLLVHGSVLERRPPAELVAAVEGAVGEPWRGEGLARSGGGGGQVPDRETLWRSFLARLGASLAAADADAAASRRDQPGQDRSGREQTNETSATNEETT